jgi:hypothetical protein
MKAKFKKPENSFTVTVTEAVFSGEDDATRMGKYGKQIHLNVLCTDKFCRFFWFPMKHIHRLPDNKMSCPMWVIDNANKVLRYRRLEWAKVKLDPPKERI